MSARKKLIEVALPLEAINEEAALRKRKAPAGYPTTLHKWWAQRPLAACRAVLFASLVDDPSSRPDEFPTESAQKAERDRLFLIIEELVRWENSDNERVLALARKEIQKATGDDPPIVLDPFCGGGSIPLEAQRLGLSARASDLNPVAVLITKGLIEIPPKFDGLPSVNPKSRQRLTVASWRGATGLAEDIRFYGDHLREKAYQRIGHLYPKLKLPKEQGGVEATVVAWLWARTVICPNPACGGRMPLVRSFWLSSKKGVEAWVEPVVDRANRSVRFQVRTAPTATPDRTRISAGTGFVGDGGKKSQATFVCVICGDGIAKGDYIDAQAQVGLMTAAPLACAVQGARRRTYCNFDDGMLTQIESSLSPWKHDETWLSKLPSQESRGTFASNAQGRRYGFKLFADYFTTRQLVALTTIADLVSDTRQRACDDAVAAGLADDGRGLAAGGRGAHAYADAVAMYLAMATSRLADYGSALSSWRPKDNAMRSVFAMQAVPMVWDFAEGNPFAKSSSGFDECVEVVAKCVSMLPRSMPEGSASQLDAASAVAAAEGLVCTDPPYYANVSYAELADFFYVWLRRTVGKLFPDLFSTLLTPKDQEIIASPYRFGGDRRTADEFFEHGLAKAFHLIHDAQREEYPLTVFYALKQTEGEVVEGDNVIAALASTGWERMLEGLIAAKLTIHGTWPMRTEGDNRQVGLGANALASSIVLVCRPRPADAPLGTRAEFVRALKSELPAAVKKLQQGNIAPVDLAQAAIGPGMAVYSRFAKVLEADGSTMRVRAALGLINQLLDESLTEQESEYDPSTRWALAWFEQHGMEEGRYGDAETLSKAKNVAVGGLVDDGFLSSRRGKVRLLLREELDRDWDPRADQRLTVWEVTQHLVRVLEKEGEAGAAGLLRKLGSVGETARDLAYRLYSTSERKGWAQDAVAYNSLVVAWPQLTRLANGSRNPLTEQTSLLSGT